jgi:hypothetical protein
MNEIIHGFYLLGVASGVVFLVLYGLLHAFFPINDKETTTSHRVWTGILFSLVIAAWLKFML